MALVITRNISQAVIVTEPVSGKELIIHVKPGASRNQFKLVFEDTEKNFEVERMELRLVRKDRDRDSKTDH